MFIYYISVLSLISLKRLFALNFTRDLPGQNAIKPTLSCLHETNKEIFKGLSPMKNVGKFLLKAYFDGCIVAIKNSGLKSCIIKAMFLNFSPTIQSI